MLGAFSRTTHNGHLWEIHEARWRYIYENLYRTHLHLGHHLLPVDVY
jgi:hypothetical protein